MKVIVSKLTTPLSVSSAAMAYARDGESLVKASALRLELNPHDAVGLTAVLKLALGEQPATRRRPPCLRDASISSCTSELPLDAVPKTEC